MPQWDDGFCTAVLNAVERLANGYAYDCDRVKQDVEIAEAQLRDYQQRLGKRQSSAEEPVTARIRRKAEES